MAGTGTQRDEARRDAPAGGEAPAQAGGITPAEFSTLFEQSFHLLWYIALGLVHDRNLAEDVVQEAAIVALGKLDQFHRDTNFNAWMGQIVRYAALNLVRRNRRHMTAATDPALLDGEVVRRAQRPLTHRSSMRLTPDAGLPGGQVAFDDRLVDALDSINETARTCLLLRTLEGMEYRDIARLLEIPEGTAMSHVHRARTTLRRRLMAPADAPNAEGGRD